MYIERKTFCQSIEDKFSEEDSVMIKRKAYDFSPNYMHIVDAAWNREASRLPIYEQHFNRKLFKDIMGVDANDLQNSANSEERRKGYRMQ